MAKFMLYLFAILAGILTIGSGTIFTHYQREIKAERERIKNLGSQVIYTDCGTIEYAVKVGCLEEKFSNAHLYAVPDGGHLLLGHSEEVNTEIQRFLRDELVFQKTANKQSMNFRKPSISPLLAVCGLYCGACYHYRASFPDGNHLLQEAIRQGRKAEHFTCRGCRSDQLYIHPGCSGCEIRACVDSGGFLHCGECGAIRCERLLAFKNDGHLHHLDILAQLEQLSQLGTEQWLEQQAQRWICGCGVPFSWYETQCHACGAMLISYGS